MTTLILALLLAAPVKLAAVPGDATEAAWSPDGTKLAFQRTLDDDADLFILELATGRVSPLVTGPGHAMFPTWSPDGKQLVYAFSHLTTTARQGIPNGCNLFTIPSGGGEPKQLTSGLQRDYKATWSPDGRTLWFTSSRQHGGNGVGLQQMPVAGGEITPRIMPAGDAAAVDATFSPDGKLLAYGVVSGIRGNWRIELAKTAEPARGFTLTPPDWVCYGPAWQPTGSLLACTGYSVGEPGWGIYLIDTTTAARLRLETGPGNSRNPCWSPDGKSLVFENNAGGNYQLYRINAPTKVPAPAVGTVELPEPGAQRVQWLKLAGQPDQELQDAASGPAALVTGQPEPFEGGWLCHKGSWLSVPKPAGLAFGTGAFSVRAVIRIDEEIMELRHIAVGDYPQNPLGWQLFLDPNGFAAFNSRDPQKLYRGTRSAAKVPLHRWVTLVGVRRASGTVLMYVDGQLQSASSGGATISYPEPVQLRIGSQFNGTNPFEGAIREVEVFARELLPAELGQQSLAEFLAE